MTRIAPTDWRTRLCIFETFGCTFIRQKGDHLIFHHPKAKRAVVIPRYNEIPVTVIMNNMKTVHMSREEYLQMLLKTEKE
ncbi:MAG: type II toxin-antitoxin system HicA family toxin [Methanospirillaceae archaeon]|nr:type II toxin-antitoxin system HicA family toxin [Methanospirillaceae archaeon]